MIHVEKNQEVPENENLRVMSQTGDYNDDDLIDCYQVDNPGISTCAFSASFIKYGGFIYRFNAPEDLGEQLFKIDPRSNHDAVSLFKEEKVRKMRRERGDYRPDKPVVAKDGGRSRSNTESAPLLPQDEATKSETDKILDSLLEESKKQSQTFSEPIPETVPVDVLTPTTTPIDAEIVSSTPLQSPVSEIEPMPVPEMLSSTPAVTVTSTEPLSSLGSTIAEVVEQVENVSSTQN